jgi:hypothetical protein
LIGGRLGVGFRVWDMLGYDRFYAEALLDHWLQNASL